MIYFDNGATTKPYKEVVDSFVKVSSEYFGNPSSLHHVGAEAEKLLTTARAQVAELLNVKPNEIIFTSGGTESNNLALKGAAFKYQSRGKHIITTTVEHASVRESINQLVESGFRVTFIPVDREGRISVKDVQAAICEETILVSIIHVNNEVGTIQPIQEVGSLLKNYPKVLFHVDNIQGIGKVTLPLHEYGIDLCSYSSHKFHGFKGTGMLFVREGVELEPLFTGGSQERKQRSGTENVAGMVAMAKALRMSLENQRNHITEVIELKEYIMNELQKIADVTVHTPALQSAPHIINFSTKGLKAEVFVHALEEKGIYVSTTSACSSKKKARSSTLIAMNVDEELASSALRLSLTYTNTRAEAEYVIEMIKETINNLKEVMK